MYLAKPTPSENFVRGWVPGRHRGMDWGWQRSRPIESTQILAAASGVVVSVYTGNGMNEGWGRRIIIEHAPGVQTTYNHLRPGGVLVTVGQKVKRGEMIGWMGTSGASTGTHLHFELYLGGFRVDPAPYFSKDLPGTTPEHPAGGDARPLPIPATDKPEEHAMKMFAYFHPEDPDRPTYVQWDQDGGSWVEFRTNDKQYARDVAYKWTNGLGVPTLSLGHRNDIFQSFRDRWPALAPEYDLVPS